MSQRSEASRHPTRARSALRRLLSTHPRATPALDVGMLARSGDSFPSLEKDGHAGVVAGTNDTSVPNAVAATTSPTTDSW